MSRRFTLALVGVTVISVLVVFGCPGGADPFVADTQDVHVLDVRRVAPQDNVAGLASGGASFLIVHVRFTNETGDDLAPRIDHFVFTASDGARFFGLESGATAVIGISHDRGVVKMNASREYTIGFRTDTQLGGTVAYEVAD